DEHNQLFQRRPYLSPITGSRTLPMTLSPAIRKMPLFGRARPPGAGATSIAGGMLLQFCYFYNPVNETPVVTQGDGATATNPASSAAPASDRADLRPEKIQDAVIRLAGNSQDGIQTAGAFLARLAGRSEHDV